MPLLLDQFLLSLKRVGERLLHPRASRLLQGYFDASSSESREEAIRRFAELGPNQATEILTSFRAAESPLAIAAISVLETVDGEGADRALVQYLSSDDDEVAIRACEALAKRAASVAKPDLRKVAFNIRANRPLADAAGQALNQIEAAGAPATDEFGALSLTEPDLGGAVSEGLGEGHLSSPKPNE